MADLPANVELEARMSSRYTDLAWFASGPGVLIMYYF